MQSGKLVTLAVYEELHEARLVKKKLEDAGIPAYIGGEALALVGSKPGLTSLKLEVAEEDLEHARLVLEAPSHLLQSLPIERPPLLHDDGLATITVFYDPIEAEHAAQLLRAHGLACRLRGKQKEFMSMLAPGIVNIELLVPEQDVDRVCEILGFSVDADQSDDSLEPDEQPKPAPHAIWSESPPPSSTPRHVKRMPQTVQPMSEDSNVAPVASSMAVESPQVLDRVPKEDDAPRGLAGWVLVLVLLLGLLLWAAFR